MFKFKKEISAAVIAFCVAVNVQAMNIPLGEPPLGEKVDVPSRSDGGRSQDVGMNQTFVNDFVRTLLQNCQGRHVIECGAGHGYLTGKMLASGASHVDAIEMMEGAARRINLTVEGYRAINDMRGTLTVHVDRAQQKLREISLTQPPLVCATLMNHYLTPAENEDFFAAMDPFPVGSTFFMTSNAPSGSAEVVRTYQTRSGQPFAGYVMRNRNETQYFDRQQKSTGFQSIETGVYPLGQDITISPVTIWGGNFTPARSMDVRYSRLIDRSLVYNVVETDTGFAKTSTNHKAMCYFDKLTAVALLVPHGWHITDMYYMDQYARRHNEYPVDLAKTTAVNFALRAEKVSIPTLPTHNKGKEADTRTLEQVIADAGLSDDDEPTGKSKGKKGKKKKK